MMIRKQMPNTRRWLLDRLAERAAEVLERNHHKSPLIAGFDTTLPECAGSYRRQYAELDLYRREVRWLTEQASAVIARLADAASSWAQRMSRHLVDFDTRPLTTTRVPHDVIAQSERLLERTRFLVMERARSIPYAELLIAHLKPLIDSAKAAFQARQDAQVNLQERRHALNETALVLEDELIALRVVLKRELGSHHRDYQYLRVARARHDAIDSPQDDIAPGPPDAPDAGQPVAADARVASDDPFASEAANDSGEDVNRAGKPGLTSTPCQAAWVPRPCPRPIAYGPSWSVLQGARQARWTVPCWMLQLHSSLSA